jgi:hypothetical protein
MKSSEAISGVEARGLACCLADRPRGFGQEVEE